VRATVRNRLDKPLIVFGFGKTRGVSDSVIVPVGEASPLSFRATTPGTLLLRSPSAARTCSVGRPDEDSQLHGVIVVEAPNAPAARDGTTFSRCRGGVRIDPASRTGLTRCTMTINGLLLAAHTKRYAYTQGDSVFWRVINLTDLDHPMHLHGFYFRMDARGNGVADTIYTAAQRRMAVTEVIPPFQTMAFAWRAERAGNWIYHCHYATHLSSLVALDTENGHLEHSALDNHASDRPHQMFGLVVG
jgi:hypothetical protein